MQGVGEAKMPGNVPLPLYGQRGCAAVIAGLGWFGLGVQLYFNIQDALVKNLPVAGHLLDYFSFFTIETNLLVALVLTIFCARPQAERFLTRPSVKSALVVYIIIVGVVYAVLLRNLWHPHGLQLLADLLLHDAIPFLYPFYWLAFLSKGSLRWSDPAWWLVYPVLYFLYSMLRGAAFGTYLYPFFDAAQLGFARVWVNGIVLLAAFIGLGVVLTAIDHALSSDDRGRSRLGRAAEL
ncbi:MAG: Pr6Pr family membrane protein [Pseudomonadota bacterium]|nr:Pr6Pr family membrane protein [Pseudomonadota bacterium]